jgi:lipid-binding SYLF domain-containing protein
MAWIQRSAMVLLLAGPLLSGCSTAPVTQEDRNELVQQATAGLTQMGTADPEVDALIRRGYGYAMFPEITKGGLVFGGGFGRGVVYEQGQHVGYASLAQASFGLQAGGHSYRELIVFETKAALDRFRENRLDFAADAEAVLADGGATANAQFIDGIVVVITPLSGAMAQAAIGGQQITYVPKQ